jgi:ribosomal protein L29
MAKKKQKELKDQSVAELKAGVQHIDKELFQLRNELAMQRKIEKPHLLKTLRKDKARMLTFLTQKQQGAV